MRLRPVFSDTNMNLLIWYTDLIWKNFFWLRCMTTIADQSAAVRLGQKKEVQKPWIFYEEGETVIEHGPNPYLALYYVKTENRQEMDRLTQEFYRDMHILDSYGKEVAYQNQIPDYTPAEK